MLFCCTAAPREAAKGPAKQDAKPKAAATGKAKAADAPKPAQKGTPGADAEDVPDLIEDDNDSGEWPTLLGSPGGSTPACKGGLSASTKVLTASAAALPWQ